jgi:hypothetical protein
MMQFGWPQLAKAFVLAAVLSSFTDWYFFGRPGLHPYYKRFAGVWVQYENKKAETRAVLLGTLVSLAGCAVFIGAAGWLGVTGLVKVLVLGLLFWIAGPLAYIAASSIFMNLDLTVAFNHAIGWLLRFVACAIGIAVFF